jgi:uncharacterized membrane protein
MTDTLAVILDAAVAGTLTRLGRTWLLAVD